MRVAQVTGAVSVAAGAYHFLALTSAGTVWAWGLGHFGQLGTGGTANLLVPAQVPGLSGVSAVAAGFAHSLALLSDGTVWAWGDNYAGQLGNGTTTSLTTPVQVPLAGVRTVAAGADHSLAVRSDGTVWAWGDNSYGQLGTGTTLDSTSPIEVPGLTGIAPGSPGRRARTRTCTLVFPSHAVALTEYVLSPLSGQPVVSMPGLGVKLSLEAEPLRYKNWEPMLS